MLKQKVAKKLVAKVTPVIREIKKMILMVKKLKKERKLKKV